MSASDFVHPGSVLTIVLLSLPMDLVSAPVLALLLLRKGRQVAPALWLTLLTALCSRLCSLAWYTQILIGFRWEGEQIPGKVSLTDLAYPFRSSMVFDNPLI